MSKQSRLPTLSSLAALLLAIGAGCSLDPTPRDRVVCDPSAPRCPSGSTCEEIQGTDISIGLCCRTSGCTTGLTPDQIGAIVDAGVGSGLVDGGAADRPTCVAEPCNTNPGFPCLEGRIECGSDSRTCKDGPKARDGTACGNNMLCVNGTCSVCTAGTACATNSDQCRAGVVICDPVGCMNGTAKSPGSSCGTDQVCSAAGTCIPCAAGASCATNPGNPCKKGAISCSSGAPQCVDGTDAPDGTFCGMDRVCRAGACMTCAAGTVCTSNPGGACKLGVVACGSATSGCVDGDNVGAGTACGSNMVCNGNGQCLMCEAGKTCTTNPGNPCKTGVIDCATGAPKCLDSGNTAAGTTCGTNQVCNGSGTCVPCTADASCTGNPSVCRNGVTSCTTGTSVCIDGTPKPATATCPGGPMCDGNGFCGVCMPNQSCTGNPTACKQGTTTCNGSATTCGDGANRAAGTSCGVSMVCDGNGACAACASGQPCSTNPGACKTGTTSCATGTQTCADGANEPAGTSCGTNMVCNGSGGCVACTANANCTTNPTACKTGIVSCATGAPVCADFGNRSAGTACGSNMVCDGNGTCVACTEGQACTGNPGACSAGVTACTTGAQTCIDGAAQPAGTSCGTNQVCNANGQCTTCTSGLACTTNPTACKHGTTSCATGVETCVDGGNKSAGAACGTNMVCDGSGACVSCAAGSACGGNPSPCKNGVISCATGAPSCVDGTSNVSGGTPCGSNQVCDGNGFCGACTEGQACSGNPNPCYSGIASCMTGAQMCVNGTAKAGGTACGPDMVCNGSGACVACSVGLSCSGNPNVCKNGATSCATGAQICVDDTNKSPGIGCGTNMVCSGSGSCVACAAGTACTSNPSVCQNGMVSCSTGAPTCVDGGNKAAGVSCGTNMVCNGSGTCVACAAGAACTTNPNSTCKNGMIACTTGAPICVDGSNKAAGTSCGTDMVCNGNGNCVACVAGGACTGNPNICKNGVYSCATGTQTCADGSNKMGGTSCGTNLVCDGNGNCGACTANQACTTNPNPCYTGITTCSTGTMTCINNTQRLAGTSCGTNMVCNSSGMCVACTAGVSCTGNPNTCKNGTTSCSTGVQTCIDGSNKTDGTGCSDGNNCTYNDVCTNGTCGGTAYSCVPGVCHSSSVCNGSGGCTVTNRTNGTGCDDGNPCTRSDVCTNGNCGGTAYSCTPTQCQASSTCNGTGGCTVTNKTNGTTCSDGNACTYADVCSSGTCAGTSYSCYPTECQSSSTCNGNGGCTVTNKPNNTACSYGDCYCCVCSGAPRCSNGVCLLSGCCNTQACCSA